MAESMRGEEKRPVDTDSGEALVRVLMDTLTVPALAIEKNGRLVGANKRFEDLVHHTLSQLRYLKKIRRFSVKAVDFTGSTTGYDVVIYDNRLRLYGRPTEIGGSMPLTLICFEQANALPAKGGELDFDSLVGRDKQFLSAKNACRLFHGMNEYVLLRGESGTGKEVLARCIHKGDPFPSRPFICLRNNLEFTEYFGGVSEKGSEHDLEQPGGVTLYLDEIADYNHYNQDRLYMLLRNSLVGNYKVICASSADLEAQLRRNELHRNLYETLMARAIQIPAIRQRRDDILPLATFFLEAANRRYGRSLTLGADLQARLSEHDWPGNLHELKSFVYVSVRNCPQDFGELNAAIIENALIRTSPASQTDALSLALAEKRLILRALNAFANARHPKEDAAKALGISLATLYRKIRQYDIQTSSLYAD